MHLAYQATFFYFIIKRINVVAISPIRLLKKMIILVKFNWQLTFESHRFVLEVNPQKKWYIIYNKQLIVQIKKLNYICIMIKTLNNYVILNNTLPTYTVMSLLRRGILVIVLNETFQKLTLLRDMKIQVSFFQQYKITLSLCIILNS